MTRAQVGVGSSSPLAVANGGAGSASVVVPMADLADMQLWAEAIMAREPDFVIGGGYLNRWWVIPRNPWCNLYLHDIRKSDDDRALHDHPWPNTSFLIFGGYIEHTPEGRFERRAGDVVHRTAETLHRLEVIPGERAISLFATGPKVREWGFACEQGWVHWRDFSDPANPGEAGRGCGEHDAPTPVCTPGTHDYPGILKEAADAVV